MVVRTRGFSCFLGQTTACRFSFVVSRNAVLNLSIVLEYVHKNSLTSFNRFRLFKVPLLLPKLRDFVAHVGPFPQLDQLKELMLSRSPATS